MIDYWNLIKPCCDNPDIIFGSNYLAGINQARCLNCSALAQDYNWEGVVEKWDAMFNKELPCMELVSM